VLGPDHVRLEDLYEDDEYDDARSNPTGDENASHAEFMMGDWL